MQIYPVFCPAAHSIQLLCKLKLTRKTSLIMIFNHDSKKSVVKDLYQQCVIIGKRGLHEFPWLPVPTVFF